MALSSKALLARAPLALAVHVAGARFYGHNQQLVTPATTLMLRLSTGFGTPAQKD